MVHKRSVFSEWYDLSSYHFAGNGAHMEIQKTDDSYHWNLFVCTEWILFLLYDRNGLLKQLQKEYHRRYPHQLKQNIINMNYPILRDAFSSYYHQVEKAIKRQDFNSLNHRVTAFLASYYDIIFAINEMLHPGEKRLLSIIEHSCPIYPPDAQKQIEQLIRNIGINDEVVLKTMNQLVDELQNMLPNELLDNRQ